MEDACDVAFPLHPLDETCPFLKIGIGYGHWPITVGVPPLLPTGHSALRYTHVLFSEDTNLIMHQLHLKDERKEQVNIPWTSISYSRIKSKALFGSIRGACNHVPAVGTLPAREQISVSV